MRKLFVLVVIFYSTTGLADTDIDKYLIGDWCLNTEEYDGDLSVDGSKWTFKDDGTYIYRQAYESIDKYKISGDTIILDNFGKMKVLAIDSSEMKGKVYSTYHFTKNECLPLVKEAENLTRLNNAILMKDLDLVKKIVAEGANISKSDTRSSIGSTPIITAIKSGHIEIVEFILSQRPDLSITDSLGRSALEHARELNNSEIIELIESANASL